MTVDLDTRPETNGLFQRPHLALTLGAVGLVTLGAFENRAVGTTLPTMVRELGSLGSFGVVTAAPLASYVVALTVTGIWCDRAGPLPPLRAGIMSFGVAQVLVGTAVSIPVVVASRVLSGLAEGLLDISLMVLVARALPVHLRPRMFSLFAAMWVLPSVLGPVVAGFVTEQVGWRWVFLGALALLVPTWLLLRPAFAQVRAENTTPLDPPDHPPATAVPWAIAASASVFLLTIAGRQVSEHPVAASLAIALALPALGLCATHLLPRGTFRAREGLPTAVAVRGLAAAAFMGVGAWLPLLLTVVHGFRPTTAGISLTITGLAWATGSWLQGRDHGWPRPMILRAGLATMTVGLALTSLLAWTVLPAAVGLGGWAVAGLGMGLTSPSLSLLVLDLSDPTNQGRNVGASQQAGSLSAAASLAVSGSLVALGGSDPRAGVFVAIVLVGAVLAMTATAVAGRAYRPG